MIMEAEVIGVSNDQGPYKIVRVRADEHEFNATVVENGGYHQSPMLGSTVTLALLDGDMGKARIIGGGQAPAERIDGQKEGEVTVINHKSGAWIKIDDDGTVTINATKVVLASGNIRLGSSGAARELALKDTATTDGATNVANLATKVYAE